MKDFDIEKIERKNIYKTPENFFDKIQENVLAETIVKSKPKKTAKIFHLNWSYAAAASLVLIFGITAFLQMDNQESAKATISDSLKTVAAKSTHPEKTEATVAYKTLENDIVEVENESPKTTSFAKSEPQKTEKKKAITTSTTNKIESAPVTEAQFEQVMNELSNTEIADIGKGAEQDVYLDLYY